MQDDLRDAGLPEDLLRELSEEKATALRRIGGHLQDLLDRLEAIASELEADGESDRAQLVVEHDALVDEAELWKWYLIVQRESLGLITHREVDIAYPVPARRGAAAPTADRPSPRLPRVHDTASRNPIAGEAPSGDPNDTLPH